MQVLIKSLALGLISLISFHEKGLHHLVEQYWSFPVLNTHPDTLIADTVTGSEISNAIYPVGSIAWAGSSLNARMTVYNDYLYLTEYKNNKIAVFDIHKPARPILVQEFSCGANPRDVSIANGNLVVVCFGASALEIYAISDPRSAVLLRTIATNSGPKMMVTLEEYGYVICAGSSTLQKFNLANPDAPAPAATVATSHFPLGIAYANGILAVVGWSQNVDLFTTDSLVKKSLTIGGSAKKATCEFFGKYLLVTDRDHALLQVLDLTTIAGATLVNSFATAPFPEQVIVHNNVAYIASLTNPKDPGSVDCLDIDDITNITRIKNVGSLAAGTGFLAVSGNYLYVSSHFAPTDLFVIRMW